MWIQPGQTRAWTNGTGSDVARDAVVALGNGGLLGVTQVAIADTKSGAVVLTGVHEQPATAADAWADGDSVYWDVSEGKLTDTATGNLLAGVAVGAKVATETTATFLLNKLPSSPQ